MARPASSRSLRICCSGARMAAGHLWLAGILLPCSACCCESAVGSSLPHRAGSMTLRNGASTGGESPASSLVPTSPAHSRGPCFVPPAALRAGQRLPQWKRPPPNSNRGHHRGLSMELQEARKLSVAPMMDYTDRFDRYFLRQISKRALLYTEMVTTGAIIHGDRDRHLWFEEAEHPIVLQLGGSDPKALAQCAKLGQEYGYDEINLNVGCPSDRVSSGFFGACLMAKPDLVAECVAEMAAATDVPVTVKHRIGIDGMDSYEELVHFVDTVSKGGCEHFIVHARIAVLGGLSPKQNREVPPLKYDVVGDLKRDFPHLAFSINGGILDLDSAKKHLESMDGVMIGRAAYHEPWNVLANADQVIFGEDDEPKTRQDIVNRMVPFIQKNLENGVPLNTMTRHMLGLFHGYLSDNVRQGRGVEVLLEAVEKVPLEIRLGQVEDNPLHKKTTESGSYSPSV